MEVRKHCSSNHSDSCLGYVFQLFHHFLCIIYTLLFVSFPIQYDERQKTKKVNGKKERKKVLLPSGRLAAEKRHARRLGCIPKVSSAKTTLIVLHLFYKSVTTFKFTYICQFSYGSLMSIPMLHQPFSPELRCIYLLLWADTVVDLRRLSNST